MRDPKTVTTVAEFEEAVRGFKEYQVLDFILLMCLEVPEQRSLIRLVYSTWRTNHFRLETPTPVQGKTESNYDGAPQYQCNTFRVDDYIKLEGMNDEARQVLAKWGAWWRVEGGYRTGVEWLLQSIAEQPRSAPKKAWHQLTIGRTGDWNYSVLKIKVFPSETKRPIKD